MPVGCPFKVEDLTEAMRKDKKAEGNLIHFVLPYEIGKVGTMDLSPDEATNLLR